MGNPCIGSGAQIANTFESQSTAILPVAGRPDAFIFLAGPLAAAKSDRRSLYLAADRLPARRAHDRLARPLDLSIFAPTPADARP